MFVGNIRFCICKNERIFFAQNEVNKVVKTVKQFFLQLICMLHLYYDDNFTHIVV